MIPHYDVVGLGIASMDYIGVTASAPLIGAKQELAQWLEAGGGPVATALVTVARLGMRACLVSGVGEDSAGKRILADLHDEGVNVDAVQTLPGTSHVAFVLAEPGRDRRTVWWHNDPAVVESIAPTQQHIVAGRALLLDTHLGDASIVAARWMREAGGIVMLDAERPSEVAERLLPLCDYLVVSELFGRAVTSEDDIARAAQTLHQRHGGVAVVTAGSNGSWCASSEALFHTPAFSIDAVDTTGAGDVFHGGLLYALLAGQPLPEAVRFASATAALKCRLPGGRAGIPTLAEVEHMLQ